MCGIAGQFDCRGAKIEPEGLLEEALLCLRRRGPDAGAVFDESFVQLGHRRLSIIDTSSAGNQPMHDPTNRYVLVYNGEFFNFREEARRLEAQSETFYTRSDTEVLLRLLIREGAAALNRVNGFFALAFYDRQEQKLLLARDRMGIKPLLYGYAGNRFCFASEMPAMEKLGLAKTIDPASLLLFLQLNYIPGTHSIYSGVQRLAPGHYLSISRGEYSPIPVAWYRPSTGTARVHPGPEAGKHLFQLLDQSVQARLIADVPVGTFLSGGIDSSIIAALAARHQKIRSFTIGFPENPHFDESKYAEEIASHCRLEHLTIPVRAKEMLEAVPEVLGYLGEPFADSSALAVFVLSRATAAHVKVALSGDGSDELFAGYQKHRAEWLLRERPWLHGLSRLVPALPSANWQGSRNHPLANRIRQWQRFSEGARLPAAERYWRWCSIAGSRSVARLAAFAGDQEWEIAFSRQYELSRKIGSDTDGINDVLLSDQQLVLPGDMLVKTDLMSMANSLEVRLPFLDYRVVEYANQLPSQLKIDKTAQKIILRETFGSLLPPSVFERRKRGFEVPLTGWLLGPLSEQLGALLDPELIKRQGLFHQNEINHLLTRLKQKQNGDAPARVWALLCFQHWWLKRFD